MYCGAGSVTKIKPRRGAIGKSEPAMRAISPAHVPVALTTIGARNLPLDVWIPYTCESFTKTSVTLACETNWPPLEITVRIKWAAANMG